MSTMRLVRSSTMLERQRANGDGTESCTASEQNDLDETGWLLEGIATPTATATASGWSLRSLLDRYAAALEKRPLLVKAVSSAIIGAFGDMISQCIFWSQDGDAVWHDKDAMLQTLAVALNGIFVNAPFLHYVYGALDEWIPADERTSYATMQVGIDVFVINPVYAAIFICSTSFFEGKSFERYTIPTIEADYVSLTVSLVVVGLILAPILIYLFKTLAVKWRVLVSDGRDIVWIVVATYIIGPAA